MTAIKQSNDTICQTMQFLISECTMKIYSNTCNSESSIIPPVHSSYHLPQMHENIIIKMYRISTKVQATLLSMRSIQTISQSYEQT